MQPISSNECVSSSVNFWYLRGMRYGFHASGSFVGGISILNRLVLHISVEMIDTMLPNSFASKEESLSLAPRGTCASCNIMDSVLNSWSSSWKLDSGSMVGSSVWLFCAVL